MFKLLRGLFTLIIALCFLPSTVIATPPGTAAFNGNVTDIFVNNTQILLRVSGFVNGSCTGHWGSYNLIVLEVGL